MLDERLPLTRYFLGNFREPISWQIDEPVTAVNLIEIDQLRTTRPGTGVRQPVGSHQRIQQAGFADVAAAQKSDLRIRLRRKLLRPGCTYYKLCQHARGQGSEARGQRADSVLRPLASVL